MLPTRRNVPPSRADPSLRTPRCYGHPDDPHGPSRQAMRARGGRGGAHRARRLDHSRRCRRSASCLGGPTDRDRRRRPGGPRPSARRNRDRARDPGHRRPVPRCGRPLRHDPVEPRHQPEHGAGGRGLLLRRLRHKRLQPDPPEWNGLPVVPGRPDTAHRGRRLLARDGGRRLLAPRRARLSGSLSGRARTAGTHLRVARRHHTVRDLELHLPIGNRIQRAVQGGGQHQPRHRGKRARRRPRRGRGAGDERAILRDRYQLHGALRRALRPAVLVGGDVGERGYPPRERRLAPASHVVRS